MDSIDSPSLYTESASKVRAFIRHAAQNPSDDGETSVASRKKVISVRKELYQGKKKDDKKRKMPSNTDESEAKRRRVRKVPRCTSPSHFYVVKSEEQKYGPEFLQKLPGRHRVDNVLRAVSSLYYRQKQVTDDAASVIEVANEHDKYDYSTIDLLVSPLRKPGVLDNWSPKEIALFEAGICTKGKDFWALHKLIKTKTTGEIVEFYYYWKKSGHYQMWKSFGKPTESLPSSRTAQWQAVKSKMRGFNKGKGRGRPVQAQENSHLL
eukprot:220888_1